MIMIDKKTFTVRERQLHHTACKTVQVPMLVEPVEPAQHYAKAKASLSIDGGGLIPGVEVAVSEPFLMPRPPDEMRQAIDARLHGLDSALLETPAMINSRDMRLIDQGRQLGEATEEDGHRHHIQGGPREGTRACLPPTGRAGGSQGTAGPASHGPHAPCIGSSTKPPPTRVVERIRTLRSRMQIGRSLDAARLPKCKPPEIC